MVATLPDLTESELAGIDAWWRANNYLTIGQIYLRTTRCCASRSSADHIKPRLLGHWGTSPGLSLHLRARVPADPAHRPGGDLPRRSRARRPGAGRRPATSRAPTPRSIPTITQDATGMRRLFRQFSAPAASPATSR